MDPTVPGFGGGGGAAVLDGWEAFDGTTLQPKAPYQDVRVRNLTVTGTATISSTTSSTGQFLAANGTKTAPGYSFTSDPDSGFYSVGANQVGVSAGDTLVQTWGSTSSTFAFTVLGAAGTKTAPSYAFSGDPDTGIFSGGANVLAFSAGDTQIGRINTTELGVLSLGIRDTAGGGTAYLYSNQSNGHLTFWVNGAVRWVPSGGADGASVDTEISRSAAAVVGFYGSSLSVGASLATASDKVHNWSSTTDPDGTVDLSLGRSAAGVLGIYGGTGTTTGSNVTLASDKFFQFSSTTDPDGSFDTCHYRVSAGVHGFGGTTGAASSDAGIQPAQTANGSTIQILSISESVTLNTGAAFTDTTANLLPAKSIILGVCARITTTITTSINWKLGDATITDRFTSNNATMTAGTTDQGGNQWLADRVTAGQGAYQAAAAKLRITLNANPGAGVVRVTVFYILLTPPTS